MNDPHGDGPVRTSDYVPATATHDNTSPAAGPGVGEQSGDVFGAFRLVRPLGHGGMGAVWLAEQSDPVKRQVALKVIKVGMDTAAIVARFEVERQALALMDHPNIAKVLDAGTTPTGRPFFAMEWVDGDPITKYCDRAQLSLRDRLGLFIPVCRAVQHAHQKGVIHRDLKPSNVLVATYDGRPVPKVIDFGIAKATRPDAADDEWHTEAGAIVGTPEYMAPEQADPLNADIDTRADVYALGVILYELLTGGLPFSRRQTAGGSVVELLRQICQQEPPRPSTRLAQDDKLADVAAQRRVEPARLPRLVRGELDWVVMKCLDKDRGRRYETANGLAADLLRFLADEPVSAGPPSPSYRLRKFVQRNHGLVTAAGLLALALVAGIVGTTYGMFEANRQTRIARAETDSADTARRSAEAVRDFLRYQLLGQADARKQADALLRLGRSAAETTYNPTVRELLDRAAAGLTEERIDARFPGQPLVQADILATIGDTFFSLQEYESAITHLQRARVLRELHLGPEHPATLETTQNLALALGESGAGEEEVRLLQFVRDAQTRLLGPDHPNNHLTLLYLAKASGAAGRLGDAATLWEQVRDAYVRTVGPHDRKTLVVEDSLAMAYDQAGRLPEARRLAEKASSGLLKELGPDHPCTLMAIATLAITLGHQGERAEAVRLLRDVCDRQAKTLGPDHPDTIGSLNNLAIALGNAGKIADAVAPLEHVHAQLGKKLRHDNARLMTVTHNLACAYQGVGRISDAIRMHETNLAARSAKLGAGHRDTLTTMMHLAMAYRDTGRLTEAISLQERTRDGWRQLEGPDHPAALGAGVSLARSYQDAGRIAEAETLLRDGLAARRRVEPDAWSTYNSESVLGGVLLAQKKLAEAEPLLVAGFEGLKQRQLMIPAPVRAQRLIEAADRLVRLYEAWDKPELAAKWKAERASLRPATKAVP